MTRLLWLEDSVQVNQSLKYLSSYFSLISGMATGQFDLWLIPKFCSVATDLPVMKWLEDLELTYMRLTKWSGSCHWDWKEWLEKHICSCQKSDVKEIKCALVKVYGTDSFMAFNRFTTRHLCPGETVDNLLTLVLSSLASGGDTMRILNEECFCEWADKSYKGTLLIFSQNRILDSKRVAWKSLSHISW